MTSAFVYRERDNTNQYKDDHRYRVIEFFEEYHEDSVPMRMLTLPCIGWKTEKLLLARRPDTAFLAVERDNKIFGEVAKTAPYTPMQSDGSNRVFTNHNACLLRGSVEDMFDRYYDFGTITCAWIDTCSQLTPKLVAFLRRITDIVPEHVTHFPLALTVIKGREYGAINQALTAYDFDRGAFLEETLSVNWRVQVIENLEYSSSRGQPLQLFLMEYENLQKTHTKQQAAGIKAAYTKARNKRQPITAYL